MMMREDMMVVVGKVDDAVYREFGLRVDLPRASAAKVLRSDADVFGDVVGDWHRSGARVLEAIDEFASALDREGSPSAEFGQIPGLLEEMAAARYACRRSRLAVVQ